CARRMRATRARTWTGTSCPTSCGTRPSCANPWPRSASSATAPARPCSTATTPPSGRPFRALPTPCSDPAHAPGAQKGPDTRRRPRAAREAYWLYVERVAAGANEADGPFSAARLERAEEVEQVLLVALPQVVEPIDHRVGLRGAEPRIRGALVGLD